MVVSNLILFNKSEVTRAMNHKRHNLKSLEVEGHQIEEAVRAIFHTVLYQRVSPKYSFKANGSYLLGAIGFEDVDCDCLELTHIRLPSKKLHERIQAEVKLFCDAIRGRQEAMQTGEPVTGEIVLQFYQKNKSSWPLSDEPVPWEDWIITVTLVSKNSESARQSLSEKLVEDIRQIILTIGEIACSEDYYTPGVPKEEDLHTVFDISYTDFLPYNFKISYQIHYGSMGEEGIVGATVKRIAQVLG